MLRMRRGVGARGIDSLDLNQGWAPLRAPTADTPEVDTCTTDAYLDDKGD
jgi:hypothetical protein